MKDKLVKLCVLGAGGRMGLTLIRCVGRFQALALAGAVELPQSEALNKDAGALAGVAEKGVTVVSDLRAAAAGADVLIDFSRASDAPSHSSVAFELGKGMVLGTTGLDSVQAEAVREASKKVPIVWSPNMSLGMNLLFSLVEDAARALNNYDVEIIETHHKHKKDAPSGTALRLLEAAASARGLDPESAATHGRRGMSGERPAGQIGLHAIRAGDVVGDHTVLLATDGERIELTHRASSRDCFAMGALRAAEWVASQRPGLYTMRHVLGLKK